MSYLESQLSADNYGLIKENQNWMQKAQLFNFKDKNSKILFLIRYKVASVCKALNSPLLKTKFEDSLVLSLTDQKIVSYVFERVTVTHFFRRFVTMFPMLTQFYLRRKPKMRASGSTSTCASSAWSSSGLLLHSRVNASLILGKKYHRCSQ